MSEMFTGLLIFLAVAGIFIVLPIWLIVRVFKLRSKNKSLNKNFISLPSTIQGFNPTKHFTHAYNQMLIAIDSDQQKVLLAKRLTSAEWKLVKKRNVHAPDYIFRLVDFKQIIRSEMLVDGNQVASRSLGGAIIGGALFGGVGAIVGSNVSSATVKKNVETVKLKLLLKDINEPAYELIFFDKKRLDLNPQAAQQECQHWHDTITVAVAG